MHDIQKADAIGGPLDFPIIKVSESNYGISIHLSAL